MDNANKTFTEKDFIDARKEIKKVFLKSLILMIVFLGCSVLYFMLIMNMKKQQHGLSNIAVRIVMLPFLILLSVGMAQVKNIIYCIIAYKKIRKDEKGHFTMIQSS